VCLYCFQKEKERAFATTALIRSGPEKNAGFASFSQMELAPAHPSIAKTTKSQKS
jgi:hypothetical protein